MRKRSCYFRNKVVLYNYQKPYAQKVKETVKKMTR